MNQRLQQLPLDHIFGSIIRTVEYCWGGNDHTRAASTAVWEWEIPSYNANSTNNFTTLLRIGFVPLSLKFWIQSFILLSIQSIFNALVAVVVYYGFVVQSTKPTTSNDVHMTTRKEERSSPNIHQLLFGYGILCPLLIAYPLYLFGKVLPMNNVALMLCLAGAIPNLLLLRVMEAIHGQLPDFCYANEELQGGGQCNKLASKNCVSNSNRTAAQSTAMNTTAPSSSSSDLIRDHHDQLGRDSIQPSPYNPKRTPTTTASTKKTKNHDHDRNSPFYMLILYFSASLQFQFDPKTNQPVPFNRTLLFQKVIKFISVFIQTSLLYSVLLPANFQWLAPSTTMIMTLDDTTAATSTTPWSWTTPYTILFSYVTSTLWKFYHPAKLINSFLMASLLSLVLDGTF